MAALALANANVYKMIGKAVLLSSMQFSIGSVEMSSRFTVTSFAKDQDTLQRAADALKQYVTVGVMWAIGVGMMQYASYGGPGLVTAIIANAAIMFWIVSSYRRAFREAAARYNLQPPTMW
jgi:hypothetical protein